MDQEGLVNMQGATLEQSCLLPKTAVQKVSGLASNFF